jgi:biofilm PGA synthesis lipoprotein PgaB
VEILKRLLPLLAFCALPALAGELPYQVIAYHDVRDHVAADYDPDQYAVSTAGLIDQFTWLRDNGFHAVSLDQIIAASQGRQALPDKAVLLTFDDGLASAYTHVFPLLKMFNYPAIVSVVTSWIESDEVIDYAGRGRAADGFLSWEQMREMQASGLVEFASHTHDLHKGVRGNPQGNLQPAAKTRLFDGSSYESEAEYRRRIAADLARSVATMSKTLGRKPRIIVWPYGAYSAVSEAVAAEQGMRITMTLDSASLSDENTLRLGRYLVTANPELGDFSAELLLEKPHPIVRVAQIDLDYVYDDDQMQQSRNLDRLLDRIKALEISHVFLQAFADPDADGGASTVYFPNRHLPMRANLFSYVAWQLKTRANVSVYAWLPMLSFVGEAFDPDWRVLENKNGVAAPDPNSEPRLSPFNEQARERIADVYEDLAAYSHFSGVLFHDDGRLSDLEDFSEAAGARYAAEFGREIRPETLASDAGLRQRWNELKSRVLLQFSSELLARVRFYHPDAKSARNIFATALLDDAGPDYLAQDFDSFLETYDFIALMATPWMEGAQDDRRFFKDLADEVRRRDEGLERTIFELQTVDWSRSTPIPDEELRSTMRWLQSIGVRNLGYYPDNFIDGRPDFHELRQGMSLANDFAGAFQ